MKTRLILSLLILLSFKGYSQSKNTISFSYGIASSGRLGTIYDAGYTSQGSDMYSLNYLRKINDRFALETGITYNVNKLQLDYYSSPYNKMFESGNANLISIPVTAKLRFLKYMFVNVGISANFATDKQNSIMYYEDISGFGFELGIGAKYDLKRISLSVNPMIQVHNLLGEAGVKFGVGYNF